MITALIIIGYVLVAIDTGVYAKQIIIDAAFDRWYEFNKSELSYWTTNYTEKELIKKALSLVKEHDRGDSTFFGTLCAIFWPLFWSGRVIWLLFTKYINPVFKRIPLGKSKGERMLEEIEQRELAEKQLKSTQKQLNDAIKFLKSHGIDERYLNIESDRIK